MSANAVRSQKRTAYVYGGAAILIVVVGLKTVLRTQGIEGEWLSYITLAALLLEFFLLILYAATIYGDAKELASPEPVTASTPVSKEILDDFAGIESKLLEAVGELKDTKESIKLNAERLDMINNRLEEITEDSIRQKVKSEVQRLLNNINPS